MAFFISPSDNESEKRKKRDKNQCRARHVLSSNPTRIHTAIIAREGWGGAKYVPVQNMGGVQNIASDLRKSLQSDALSLTRSQESQKEETTDNVHFEDP